MRYQIPSGQLITNGGIYNYAESAITTHLLLVISTALGVCSQLLEAPFDVRHYTTAKMNY